MGEFHAGNIKGLRGFVPRSAEHRSLPRTKNCGVTSMKRALPAKGKRSDRSSDARV